MPRAIVTFLRCIQDSQDYGSNNEHMVSRVFFTLQLPNREPVELYSDMKQTVGGNFETSPIEVLPPRDQHTHQEYGGVFNYNTFRDCAERYFRGLVGSQGTGIRIQGGTNIRMRNLGFDRLDNCEFDI